MPQSAPQPPQPIPPRAEGGVPKTTDSGVLFRALVEAGADPGLAYTAEAGTKSMVSEAVATQVQPILVEMRQLFAEQDRKLDALAAKVAEHGLKLDALAAKYAEHDRKLDALAAKYAEHDRKLDALAAKYAEHDRKLDALAAQVGEHDHKLDALTTEVRRTNEVVDVKLDGIRRELRLIWGALGISLTVWLVVLGYLLSN